MKRAQFVAIRIAKVREINPTGGALSHARWVFDRRAAIRDPGFVPCLGLFGIAHREAERAPIGSGGRLAVDGFGHHETPAIVRICQPALGVHDAGLTTHRDEQGIVKFPRPSDVVTPDHNMAEHFVLLLIKLNLYYMRGYRNRNLKQPFRRGVGGDMDAFAACPFLRAVGLFASMWGAGILADAANAQTYPNRSIRCIVAYVA